MFSMSKIYQYGNKKIILQLFLIFIAFLSLLITLLVIRINTNYNNGNIKLWSRLHLKYSVIKARLLKPNVRPRIFCMITTTYANHDKKAIHVRNTWAQRCDQYLFISSRDNSTLPAIKACDIDDRDHLWCKV